MGAFRRRSGAIVCPRCSRLVEARARRCPACGMWRPSFWGFGPALLKVRSLPFRDGIIALCGVLYAGSLALHRGDGPDAVAALAAPTPAALITLGATGRITVELLGRWETLLTAVFLHGSLLHILFNLLWTWQLAAPLCELYDAPRFLLIFLAAGVAGNAAGVFIDAGDILVGASGGVYGLFGALVWYGFRRGGVFGAGVFRFGLFWAGLGLVLSFAIPNCAVWAHIGGFFAGAGAAAVLGYRERRPSNPAICLGALVAGIGVFAAFFAYLGFPPEGLDKLVRLVGGR
ncbi:MAG TPA: rhomboid family intramembrane serine protease [Planctomycetota bacterium]|nr:rhomboid family intramembrane serine protease [Planctomycetota bacterium]OQC21044.1 MAG: Rhomboid protease GluP [Planctomycetes bacterium ADurb.Bin069]HNR99434.1 rhomboid family intramembrane serine protease [Planctomycetota bacterium]HNU25974.1 rhomboid family intramembrane serine protease [Planctomycetota bacterium]HOE30339.1 rhomboid family intramembrane serine protease [Planctomycetota bacterium]